MKVPGDEPSRPPSKVPTVCTRDGYLRIGHEIQPNILRARLFRLYRYTGREERNLERWTCHTEWRCC